MAVGCLFEKKKLKLFRTHDLFLLVQTPIIRRREMWTWNRERKERRKIDRKAGKKKGTIYFDNAQFCLLCSSVINWRNGLFNCIPIQGCLVQLCLYVASMKHNFFWIQIAAPQFTDTKAWTSYSQRESLGKLCHPMSEKSFQFESSKTKLVVNDEMLRHKWRLFFFGVEFQRNRL